MSRNAGIDRNRSTPSAVLLHGYACCARPEKFAHFLPRPLLLQSLTVIAAWFHETAHLTTFHD